MGDPETEVVMPRLKNDLVELFVSVYDQTLKNAVIEFDERACATIMAVSEGYPGEYRKNIPIRFDDLQISQVNNAIVFHAGTKLSDDRITVTNGGRVLAVTSFGRNIADAVQLSKNVLKSIHFEGMYYRKDIGYEFQNSKIQNSNK
jgi:phosphoribosylamine--glycine ligase